MTVASDEFVDASRRTVLRALRAVPGDLQVLDEAIREVVVRGDEAWDAFVRCASQHGVLGVVDAELSRRAVVPSRLMTAVERRQAVAAIWHEHLMTGLEAAAGRLAEAGIAVCALKGPLIVPRLYPAGATRHSLDIDLLVHEHDLDRAIELLVGIGFRPDKGRAATYLRRHGHHVHLRHGALPTLELHFRAYAGFGVTLPASLLIDRAQPHHTASGRAILVPHPVDEFIYLATHAAGHSFIRLMWLYDLKLLLLAHPALDWDVVRQRASKGGVESAVAYAVYLLHEWLAVPTPALPAGLRRRSLRSRLADRLLAEVSTPQPVSARDNLGGLIFTSLLCDRVVSGARLIQHHVLRSVRRKLHDLAPRLSPEEWSG